MGVCCMKVTPCLFFFFNQIFFILGALVVGCGVFILLEIDPFISLLQVASPAVKTVSYVLIAAGGITLVKGFLGCASTLCGVQCFLGLYVLGLLVILVSQVATGVYLYQQESGLKGRIESAFIEILQVYEPENDTIQPLNTALDYVQYNFSCCGWNGPEDWKDNTVLNDMKWTFYPCSCRNDSDVEFGFCAVGKKRKPGKFTVDDWPVRKTGCQDAVFRWLEDNFDTIFGISIGLAVTELLGILLACCVCHKKGWLC